MQLIAQKPNLLGSKPAPAGMCSGFRFPVSDFFSSSPRALGAGTFLYMFVPNKKIFRKVLLERSNETKCALMIKTAILMETLFSQAEREFPLNL